jgi:asparagine synthase (glutamine-hydrolysing)
VCGIAGIVGEADGGLIRAMTRVLAHRGPDGEGYYLDRGIALGHRRLSIIDLASGQQPMTTLDGRFTIVFNGEIYNFRELRKELEGCGARFRTRSDTEVLLAAYAQWGRGVLTRLLGMFAFAVWDRQERKLFAACDRLGVKPLYYAQLGEELLLGSEIKALLAHPRVKRELDGTALDDYLTYLYVPAPKTIFRGIRALEPGHWLEWQHGRVEVGRYWDVNFEEEPWREDDLLEALRAHLHDAVSSRLISDVPLGVFLSGGLDSSTIAALMARHLSEPVRTFTLEFREGSHRHNETPYALEVAEAIKARTQKLIIEPRSAELLPAVTRHFDEPFGNPTSLLVYQLSQVARMYVTVALVGDAGDETFLGYPRYRGAVMAEKYRHVPAFIRSPLAKLSGFLPEPGNGHHFPRRLREFLFAGVQPPEQAYFAWVGYFDRSARRALYSPELRRTLADYDSSAFLMELFARSGARQLLDRINYVDLHSFLPYNLLRYADRMSMAHGLEIRCPFTDHRLIEYLARVPWQWKLHRGTHKYLLRRAMGDLLPESILTRSKIGLNPPMDLWLREHHRYLLDEYLSPEAVRKRGYFRPQIIQKLISEHVARRRDYSLHLWALISFEEWHRQYLDSNPAPAMAARAPKLHAVPV